MKNQSILMVSVDLRQMFTTALLVVELLNCSPPTAQVPHRHRARAATAEPRPLGDVAPNPRNRAALDSIAGARVFQTVFGAKTVRNGH